MLYLLDTFDLRNTFPVHHLSGSFYLYTTLAFLFLSILPALVAFVSGEKINPFYTQKKVSYYFTCFVLLLGIFLFTNTLYYDGDFEVVINDPFLFTDFQSEQELVSSTSDMFKSSMLISYSRIGLLIFTLVAIILSYDYLTSVRYNHFEFYMYILLSTFAMIVLISSNHALLTYLAIELQSLSLYLMASSYRKSIHSIEAGLKYVFIGSLASGALLIGFAMLYLATGTLDFSQASVIIHHLFLDSMRDSDDYHVLSDILGDFTSENFYSVVDFGSTDNYLGLKFTLFTLCNYFMPMLTVVYSTSFYLYLSAGLIIFALLLKMASAPFHTWLPDVYDGAPTSATTYFLLVPKIAIIVILYRFTHELFLWDELSYMISDLGSLEQYLSDLQYTTFRSKMLYHNVGLYKFGFTKNLDYIKESYDHRFKDYVEDAGVMADLLVDHGSRYNNRALEIVSSDNKKYFNMDNFVNLDINDGEEDVEYNDDNERIRAVFGFFKNPISYISNNDDLIFNDAHDLNPHLPQRFQHVFAPAIILSVLYSFIIGYSGLLKKGINLKRFFAFSSIGHLGFILLPFTLNPDYIVSSTLSSVVIYMFLYILATIPSIKVIMLFTSSKIFSSVGRKVHYSIDRLPSLFHIISPANALFVFVLFITFVGIPPTAGFFMKLYPLLGLVSSPNSIVFFIWPIIVFSSYVYVRVLVSLFFGNFNENDPRSWANISTSEGYISTWLSSFSMLFLATYAFQIDIIEVIAMDMIL